MMRRHLTRFLRDDSGSLIVFSLFLIIMMLIIGGMAVDFMRAETRRAELQSTLDRAVLAAADLDQEIDATEVVESYFAAAGLQDYLDGVTLTEDVNERTVLATASSRVDTMFLDMLGMEELLVPTSSSASEAESDIEIMLVLDVSGSMANNNKLQNLRTAAIEFVETVLANNDENRISIGIVPFNGQVNLGPVLRQQYNVTDLHGVPDSNCVDLPAAAYADLDLDPSLELPMTAWADSFTTTTRANFFYLPASNGPWHLNRWCPANAGNTVFTPTTSIADLTAHINGLTAIGATSINAGMRWGMELLDPGSRPMFSNLIALNHMPAALSGRPYDYDRNNTMKFVVLMTDGEHFPEERVNPAYRDPDAMSPIWYSPGDDRYSIMHDVVGADDYWVPHRVRWQATPWDSGGGATQLKWTEVWVRLRMHWVAWQLYARAFGTGNPERLAIADAQMAEFRTLTPASAMDAQLASLCADARAQGVMIFGIAFEAPPNGQAAISSCASSPAHYFDAQGLEIRTAFRAIANQIRMLRLTQ